MTTFWSLSPSVAWSVATFCGAALAIAAKPWADLMFRRIWEKRALRGELADIERHFDRDLVVIDAMLAAGERPGFRLSSVHAKRLPILPDSLILQPDSFRDLPPSWMSNVYYYKLMMRNLTIDLMQLIEILENGSATEIAKALFDIQARLIIAKDRTWQLRTAPAVRLQKNTTLPVLQWSAQSKTESG